MSLSDLQSLTVVALRKLARDLDIPGRNRMRKYQLVEAIFHAQTRVAAPAATPALPEPLPMAASPGSAVHVSSQESSIRIAAIPVDDEFRPQATAGGDAVAKVHTDTEGDTDSDTEDVTEGDTEEPDGSPRERTEDDVFIDRGLHLPLSYPGARFRVLVRDPHAIYVYWEIPEDHRAEQWVVTALDHEQRVLDSFRVDANTSSGYLQVSPEAVDIITLSALEDGVVAAPLGELKLVPIPSAEPPTSPMAPEGPHEVTVTAKTFERRLVRLKALESWEPADARPRFLPALDTPAGNAPLFRGVVEQAFSVLSSPAPQAPQAPPAASYSSTPVVVGSHTVPSHRA